MTLGNHEFDYSLEVLAEFVDTIKDKTPVISSNVEVSALSQANTAWCSRVVKCCLVSRAVISR